LRTRVWDSEILAEVYLELIGGRQPDLVLAPTSGGKGGGAGQDDWRPTPRPNKLASRLTADEEAAHKKFVEKMGEDALWPKLG
jgi:DNA polymerase-3 subunit epsilon